MRIIRNTIKEHKETYSITQGINIEKIHLKNS